jgi:formate hydrogenlyase subunit 3/multisubunit Na+/H+ antiporter MnhD subunit
VALSGLPPAPAFWARFFLLEALVQAGPAEAVASLLTAGLLAIASIAAATRADPAAPATAGPPALAGGVASWLGVLAAAAVGLAPASAAAAVFGGLGS